MKKILTVLLLFFSVAAKATTFTDLKFGQYQIADSQWNVSACMYTATCQIYSTNPGTMYQIPWYNGQWNWQSGQYVQFALTGDPFNPYEGKVYNSDGTLAGTIGAGHIINMGVDSTGKALFFFVGYDNDTGQLFSTNTGLTGTGGYTWTGTLNPTTSQVDTFANSYGSTTPLAAGQSAQPSQPTGPVPTAIYNQGTSNNVYITNHYPTSNNSPVGEGAANAFDNNPYTKYLNFDKYNAGVTVKLNAGRAVTGFTLTTANDFPGRDPTSYKLYGSNDGINWTKLQEGNLSLSDDRYWTSSMISVTNTTAYVYYYIFFPTTKAGDAPAGCTGICAENYNSMQIAEITFYYDYNSTTTSTDTGTGSVNNPSDYCCGGTAAPFNSNAQFTNRVNAFSVRPYQDTVVSITQIGNYNSATVLQSGTKNNYSEIYVSGHSNTTNTTQTSTSSTAINYIELDVIGNSNTVNLTQNSTGGTKGIYATVNDASNNLTINQSGGGNHYAEINLTGGNKTVNVSQSGSAAHMANINLSGGATSISTTQSGSTQQYYSITHNCAQASCAAITVTQGQ